MQFLTNLDLANTIPVFILFGAIEGKSSRVPGKDPLGLQP
jgi:hypothetical protein